MSRPIVVVGGGGHARVIVEALRAARADILGYVDREDRGEGWVGAPYLGSDETLPVSHSPATVELANGLGPRPRELRGLRRERFEALKRLGYDFATIVHPSVIVAAGVDLGEGCQVMAGAVIQPGCRIGVDSVINTAAVLDHDCSIGRHVHLAPGATLCGRVVVDDDAFLGAGTIVIDGVRIGHGSLVAAGTVVTADVAGESMVAGVPGRCRGRR